MAGCLTMMKSQLLRPGSSTLQVLSFQTAKTIFRLIALYSSLSDRNFSTLLAQTLKSPGVAFLNNNGCNDGEGEGGEGEGYLFSLACSESLDELDALAAPVSRLARKCTDRSLRQFDAVYSGLKSGAVVSLSTGSDLVERRAIERLEGWVSATSELHAAMGSLSEMESSKLRARQFNSSDNFRLAGYFRDRISRQRKRVRKFKRRSLWSKTYDQCVGPMGFIICAIFSRICRLFGDTPSVVSLPRIEVSSHARASHTRRFWRLRYAGGHAAKTARASRLTPPTGTLGGAGLALRYANLVILAEEQFYAPLGISDDARRHIYEMLTCSLKAKIRGKMMRGEGEGLMINGAHAAAAAAEGWREEVEGVLTWLGPMAHDALQWNAERNLEKQSPSTFDASRPNVMMLQTFYFSDLEKAEAAIVDVFVGLSHVYTHEKRRRSVVDDVFFFPPRRREEKEAEEDGKA